MHILECLIQRGSSWRRLFGRSEVGNEAQGGGDPAGNGLTSVKTTFFSVLVNVYTGRVLSIHGVVVM